ncbi:MAG: transposase [Candidatus Cloacimonas sp.]|jgi:putative transposase|nr:transposase [Candidatus Cloacimonas sp.]HNQ39473.1 transposase [Candidatus Cloacimonas sp.]HNS84909.1 transposase [Candidatus Cloacimonas sp.]HQO46642.1 transposase [Candidatus Cloacimonas sp.]HQP32752.1 transposase [Candidatus Cloacimonas sp.]
MRLKKEQFQQGSFYHFYNHSAKGQILFPDESDYEYCIQLINKYLPSEYFMLGAYCLMPNHYHFLIQQLSCENPSMMFYKIWNHYSRYYNKKYQGFGSIFCGKLQHVYVSNEKYLIRLVCYIHLNPVSTGLIQNINDWKWSDYLDWIDKRRLENFDSRLRDMITTPGNYKEILSEMALVKQEGRLFIDDKY